MPGERIGANLLSWATRLSFSRSSLKTVEVIFENYVPKFVRKSAALPHRMTRAGHTYEDVLTRRIKHGQPVFVCFRLNNRDVVPRESFDDPDQIS